MHHARTSKRITGDQTAAELGLDLLEEASQIDVTLVWYQRVVPVAAISPLVLIKLKALKCIVSHRGSNHLISSNDDAWVVFIVRLDRHIVKKCKEAGLICSCSPL